MTIKNGDLPAMPITGEQANDCDYQGMSKRETIAMHMMAGMMSSAASDAVLKCRAEVAVLAADALLAELERRP